MNTPRELVHQLNAAQNEAARQALRDQILRARTPDEELVPGQEEPEPVECMDLDWSDRHGLVGSRSQVEVAELLQDGLALSLELGGDREYEILGFPDHLTFEVYVAGEREWLARYDRLEDLLKAEGTRPAFDLAAFELIG